MERASQFIVFFHGTWIYWYNGVVQRAAVFVGSNFYLQSFTSNLAFDLDIDKIR